MTVSAKLPATIADVAQEVVSHLQDAFPLHAWVVMEHGINQQVKLLAVNEDQKDLSCGDILPAQHLVGSSTPFQFEKGGPVYFVAVRVPIEVQGLEVAALAGISEHMLSPGAYRERHSLGSLLAQMLAQIWSLQTRLGQAETLSQTDPLTGLLNRRGWTQGVAREHARSLRHGTVAMLVAADIDDFKFVNDTQGHPAGDTLLQKTADIFVQTMRASDLVARVGGDEFALLAVECPEESSPALLERLRAALTEAGIRVSFGLAQLDAGKPWTESWEAADRALYRDKRQRRRGAD